MIACKDIVKITKEKTALVIPNAVQICTRDEKYYFTSFAARDKTFLVLDRVRKCAAEDQVSRFHEKLHAISESAKRLSLWLFPFLL